MIDERIIDEKLLAHIKKNPEKAVRDAVHAVQMSAYLLDSDPSPLPANDVRLVANLIVNTRILYLCYNSEEGIADAAVYELAGRKGKE